VIFRLNLPVDWNALLGVKYGSPEMSVKTNNAIGERVLASSNHG
jgi:hypothetical protein